MAKQVQIRRGTSTENDAFTGAVGEVTADTTNKRLRVHDGSTAGGTALAKMTDAALRANNLSDLAAKYTAYDNLSVHGADVASAGTIDLESATGVVVDVTGTTTVTAITLSDGHERIVRFTGVLTLTNGSSLVLPGAQNIATAVGDYAVFRGYAAGVVRCIAYTRASGHPVIVGQSTIASASTTDLGSKVDQSIVISGTTTITSFGSTAPTGAIKYVEFNGASLTLTHNATSLICPGGLNITTIAGDCMTVRHEGSGNWRVLHYSRGIYPPNQVETWGIALSDETTAIATGTNKATMSLPYAFVVTNVYATLNTVSSSGIPTVDIKEAGVSILSSKLTIDASEKTSATAATPAVISDSSIAANAEIGFDITVAGTGAKGLKVFIQGYRA